MNPASTFFAKVVEEDGTVKEMDGLVPFTEIVSTRHNVSIKVETEAGTGQEVDRGNIIPFERAKLPGCLRLRPGDSKLVFLQLVEDYTREGKKVELRLFTFRTVCRVYQNKMLGPSNLPGRISAVCRCRFAESEGG